MDGPEQLPELLGVLSCWLPHPHRRYIYCVLLSLAAGDARSPHPPKLCFAASARAGAPARQRPCVPALCSHLRRAHFHAGMLVGVMFEYKTPGEVAVLEEGHHMPLQQVLKLLLTKGAVALAFLLIMVLLLLSTDLILGASPSSVQFAGKSLGYAVAFMW
jgi:hypothetical protein